MNGTLIETISKELQELFKDKLIITCGTKDYLSLDLKQAHFQDYHYYDTINSDGVLVTEKRSERISKNFGYNGFYKL